MRRFPFTVVLLAAVVTVLALGRGPAESAFPGANGKIAFDRGPYIVHERDIYVVNVDANGLPIGEPTNLTKNPKVDWHPAWSPDGGKIAFMSNRDGNYEIYVMNADGSGQTNLTNYPAAYDNYPAWSPDGAKIAFVSDRDGNYEIYVMNADGSGVPTNFTNYPAADDEHPAWSPDGTKIAFTSNRNGNDEIYVMNADGSGQTNLTKYPGAYDAEPAWSPDGSKIAFTSARDGNFEIYVMNADGSGQTNLSNSQHAEMEPAWSPDGTKIAFTTDLWGTSDAYVMTADGFWWMQVTDNPEWDTSPDWQPAVGSSGQDMPVGNNVTANMDGVTMTCSQVTSAGKATLTTTKGGPPPSSGYGIIPGVQGVMLYYEISTTATCQPPIRICITYDDTKLPCAEKDIKLAKRVGGDWVYLANQTLDMVNNIVCGETDSLSLFLMLGPVPVGGTVELAAGGDAPAAASGWSGGGDQTLPIAAAAAGAVAVLGAGAWYARRRWLR